MRADVYLVAQGTVSSRTLAQKLIAEGAVRVDGRCITKPAEDIPEGIHQLDIQDIAEMRYVGRGGLKLEAALKRFSLDVTGWVMADVGASTGGFTDCLLRHGAARVYCIDAGHGQLHPRLAEDARVRSVEGCNARYLTPSVLAAMEPTGKNLAGAAFDGIVDGCVMDVSFISQTVILPALSHIVRPQGCLVSLIKPQFEAGPGALSRRGVVQKEKDRLMALERVLMSAESCGFVLQGHMESPLEGGDGNREYLAYFIRK